MKTTTFWIALLSGALGGCVLQQLPLDVEQMRCMAFEPLQLQHKEDLLQLRFDLIRQTTTERINDSLSEMQDVPCHRIGFYLGNGLYYDLDHNLSFREDLPAKADLASSFQMEKTILRPRRKTSEWYSH